MSATKKLKKKCKTCVCFLCFFVFLSRGPHTFWECIFLFFRPRTVYRFIIFAHFEKMNSHKTGTLKTQVDFADCIGSAMVQFLRPKNKLYEIIYVQASADTNEETDEPCVRQSFRRVICKLVESFTRDLEPEYAHLGEVDRIPTILMDQLYIHCEIDSSSMGLIERHILRNRPYYLDSDMSSSVVFVSCTQLA
jgi:hypothetical protein